MAAKKKEWEDFVRKAKERLDKQRPNYQEFNTILKSLTPENQLKQFGIAVFPLYDYKGQKKIKEEAEKLRAAFRLACETFPEFNGNVVHFDTEPPFKLIGYKKPPPEKSQTPGASSATSKESRASTLAMGGFGAFGMPSSFHNNFVRERRLELMKSAVPKLWKPYMEDKQEFKLEQIIDRMMLRMRDNEPTAEAWHRDIAKHTEPDDELYGGWINFDDEDQIFSCVPGSYNVRLPTEYNPPVVKKKEQDGDDEGMCSEGFAPIHKNDHKVLEELRLKIEIPSLHVLVFNEKTVHEIAKTKAKKDMYRLFTGWRITKEDEPLQNKHPIDKGYKKKFGGYDKNTPTVDAIEYGIYESMRPVPTYNLRPSLLLQSSMPIKSGQLSPMWAKLNFVNSRHLLLEFSKSFKDDVKFNFKIENTAIEEFKDKIYYIVPRFLSSLQQLNLKKYPPYSEKEIEILIPARSWLRNGLSLQDIIYVNTSDSGSSDSDSEDSDSDSEDTDPESEPDDDPYYADFKMEQELYCPIAGEPGGSCETKRYMSKEKLNDHLILCHTELDEAERQHAVERMLIMERDKFYTPLYNAQDMIERVTSMNFYEENELLFISDLQNLLTKVNISHHEDIRKSFLIGAKKLKYLDARFFLKIAQEMNFKFTLFDFSSIWYDPTLRVSLLYDYFNFEADEYKKQNRDGDTSLHYFLKNVHDGRRNIWDPVNEHIFTSLIKNTDLNAINLKGETPLIVAAMNKQSPYFLTKYLNEAVRLIKKPLDSEIKDLSGNTAENYYLQNNDSLFFESFYEFVPVPGKEFFDENKIQNILYIVKYGIRKKPNYNFLLQYMKKYFKSNYAQGLINVGNYYENAFEIIKSEPSEISDPIKKLDEKYYENQRTKRKAETQTEHERIQKIRMFFE